MVKTFQDLYDACGGTLQIAYTLQIHQTAVERWQRVGIPQKHWDTLVKLSNGNVTPGELYSLTKKADDRRKARGY